MGFSGSCLSRLDQVDLQNDATRIAPRLFLTQDRHLPQPVKVSYRFLEECTRRFSGRMPVGIRIRGTLAVERARKNTREKGLVKPSIGRQGPAKATSGPQWAVMTANSDPAESASQTQDLQEKRHFRTQMAVKRDRFGRSSSLAFGSQHQFRQGEPQ